MSHRQKPQSKVHTTVLRGQGGDRLHDKADYPGYRTEYVSLNETSALEILFEIHKELTRHDTNIEVALGNWNTVKDFAAIMMEHYEADPKHAETMALFKELVDDIKDLFKLCMGET